MMNRYRHPPVGNPLSETINAIQQQYPDTDEVPDLVCDELVKLNERIERLERSVRKLWQAVDTLGSQGVLNQ